MKIGDRVMLTEKVAQGFERTREKYGQRPTGWLLRVGIVKRIRRTGEYGVQWAGRRSLDYLNPVGLRRADDEIAV